MKKILLTLVAAATFMLANQENVMYKSPTCGCCTKWLDHMKENNFEMEVKKSNEMNTIKENYKVPKELSSCHTAVINGYVVEGHVPAKTVEKLLKEKPAIIGIASPGMPLGSPGMEFGDRKQENIIYAFDKDGNKYIFDRD